MIANSEQTNEPTMS